MILAAGLGTRLRPLTDRVPKALVEVAGTPMLERVARRLIAAGVDRLVINVHHHADAVRRFLEAREGFGVDVRISPEREAALETGGGLLQAREHFRGDRPFFLHNVDVISEAPLEALYRGHVEAGGRLATLAVSDRDSSRLLRFDDHGLQGRVDRRTDTVEEARPATGPTRDLAFAGIHVVSPEWFDLVEERGAFSIIGPYLRLAGSGRRVAPFHIGSARWLEIGTLERLERARRVLEEAEGIREDG